MSNKRTKKAFTLAELIVAVGVFAVFLTSIVMVLVDVSRGSRRIQLEEQIYQDMRAMTTNLTRLVENNAIDYEEYYSQKYKGSIIYGDEANWGEYATLFYDFGSDGVPGASWNNGDPVIPGEPGPAGGVIDKTTLDRNIGINGSPSYSANAFCDPCPPVGDAGYNAYHKQTQLFLLNEDGNRKTFLALEPVTKVVAGIGFTEHVLSILWMNGEDTDGDEVVDTWEVAPEFTYDGDPASLNEDLDTSKLTTDAFEEFIPLTPMRTNILDLQFYVNPLEDPYKGFAENDMGSDTLVQPHVTIIMTVEPSITEIQDYVGPVPRKTLQTTIYSEVRNNVNSYATI